MGFAHEIIGLQLKVVDSTSKNLVGLTGIILDESKETITIQSKDERKICLIKRSLTQIKISLDEEKIVELQGSDLFGRSWDRIKG